MTTALVTGAGGFIGGHLVRRLAQTYDLVTAIDIKRPDMWWQFDGSLKNVMYIASTDVANIGGVYHYELTHADEIYHLAADMGGMGFIESHKVDCMKSILPTINVLDVLDPAHQRFFFSSSACVYPAYLQRLPAIPTAARKLKEEDAIPADPEPGYGWEKLYAEQLIAAHQDERGLYARIARFHNVYGPYGSWKDGREKAPAAICRKVAVAWLSGDWNIEIWGDGTQRRSFMYVDDCVDGIQKIMACDVAEPLNLGTEEDVSINDFVDAVELIAFGQLGRLRRHHVSGALGVPGRNSDNTLLRDAVNWEPRTPLVLGLEPTYRWIFNQVKKEMNV